MTECSDIDLEADDAIVNRALLYRDRRDFVIQKGDIGKREIQGRTGLMGGDDDQTGSLEHRPAAF